MIPLRIALGTSDFIDLRADDCVYVDKTQWVADVLMDPTKVLLFTRPRRFGKTLNMTTLRAFVERSDRDVRPYFADLAIAHAGEAVWLRFQRSPVVWLTFKDVKAATWADATAINRDLDWASTVSFEQGVATVVENIDYWAGAPLWDEESIATATEPWFRLLSESEGAV